MEQDPSTTPDGAVAERPLEAREPMRSPLALIGTAITGALMGAAEVVPGFSGGTVALVAGVYERLIAAIRQVARALSLLIRGRSMPALRALLANDWWFVVALLIGMIAALATVAEPLRTLIDERPVEMSAVFLGLVLGAAAVATRRLRQPRGWHALLGIAAAVAAFIGLGASPGPVDDPSLVVLFAAGAVAVTAWILPGVSGSFLLLVLGLYTPVLDALAGRDVLVLLVFGLGCGLGLAGFSTALNWLLSRFHDIVLAVLIGLMAGSSRVLWPWPEEAGFGSPELGPPVGDTAFLAAALALVAFAAVWLLGVVASGIERFRHRRRPFDDEVRGDDVVLTDDEVVAEDGVVAEDLQMDGGPLGDDPEVVPDSHGDGGVDAPAGVDPTSEAEQAAVSDVLGLDNLEVTWLGEGDFPQDDPPMPPQPRG